MTIFGRRLGEYVRFEAGLLALITVVGVVRFGLYQSGIYPTGAPNAAPPAQPEDVASFVRWFSMTAVFALGALTLGVTAHRRGFGGYRHLLPLNLLAAVVVNWISALGVFVAIVFETDTIYSLPRFTAHGDPSGRTLHHALGHLFLAPIVMALAGWMVSALVMLLTRPRPKKTRAAAVTPGDAPATDAPAPTTVTELPAPSESATTGALANEAAAAAERRLSSDDYVRDAKPAEPS
jgi:hypothetical protein